MSEKPTETYLGTGLRKFTTKAEPLCRRPKRFHHYPRFESDGPRIATRLFPINLPLGPKRPHSALRRPPALGVGSVWGLKNKERNCSSNLPPIQRPEEAEFNGHRKETVNKVYIEHERCADAVKYRGDRNEPGPELWQKVGCQWDQVQCRPNQYRLYETGCPPLKLLHRADDYPSKEEQEATILPEIEPTPQQREQFARPMPGYGGYIPRYPVEARPPKNLVNISKLTYRAFPSSEYTKQVFAHQGPLSKTVTTAPPFNPFNKVDNWNSRPKKLLWKRDNRVQFICTFKK